VPIPGTAQTASVRSQSQASVKKIEGKQPRDVEADWPQSSIFLMHTPPAHSQSGLTEIKARETLSKQGEANSPRQLRISRLWPRSARAVSVDSHHPFARLWPVDPRRRAMVVAARPRFATMTPLDTGPDPLDGVLRKQRSDARKRSPPRPISALCGERSSEDHVVPWK
jgi:hypothetical protein